MKRYGFYVDTGTVLDREEYKEMDIVDCMHQLNKNEDQLLKLQETSSSKQAQIQTLENKIHRMRKEINRLENMYHYKTADIKRENSELKEEIEQVEDAFLAAISLYLDDGYKILGKICEEKEEAIKILKEIIMELEEGVDEDEIRYELWRRKEIIRGKW